jgi:hypothetical protein
MAMDIRSIEEMAINPLHATIIIAELLSRMLKKEHPAKSYPLEVLSLPYLVRAEFEDFPKDEDGALFYPDIETGGVAGLYQELIRIGAEIIFANDLSMDIHGIDAIAFHPETQNYLICEAKGTSLERFHHFSYYLRKTRRKNRQLSHEWCWASILDYAYMGTTAHIFLKMLEHILEGNYERLLCVSHLSNSDLGYSVVASRIWSEAEFSKCEWLSSPYDLSRHRSWLEEIKKAASVV